MAANGADIASWAQQWIGTPYQWGGTNLTSGVDCSGFVQQVYKHFGINLSRTTYSQIGEGKGVGMDQLQAGDLVFFDTDPSHKGADHVGIYIGNGKMIHAPRPGKGVEVTDMTGGYYQGTFMGGRRSAGVQGGGSAGDWNPTDTKQLSPEELAAEYGWAYSFLNSNKELRGVFSQAVENGWTPAQFQAHLGDTKWWKENSTSMKQAQMEKATDPATYNAKMDAITVQIQQLAGEMGASIPHNKLRSIAEKALTTNMDEDLIRDTLGRYIKFQDNGSTLTGAAGQYEHDIRQFAYNQGIDMDKQSIKNQAQLIARKLATPQDFKDQITEQAMGMYPAYSEQLKGGDTMMDIASPYIQQMSKDLELPYTSINLKDPTIRRALNGLDPQGKPTGMSLTDFEASLKNDPRWRKTQAAQDQVMNSGVKVLKDMGLMA